MLVDPNHIWLGAEAASDTATVTYADASLTPNDDTDTIDPTNFTSHWSWTADFTGGSLTLTDDDTNTDLLSFSHGSAIGIHTDVSFGGTLDGVNIADNIVRLSAFANGATNVSVRATDTDVDEIFEFDRNGSSDYQMYLHTGGNRVEVFTEAHDVLREGDAPYSTIHNNGAEVHSGPSVIDFGTDITASSPSSDTVLVEYTGGTVPGRVHDDGTEVLTDANGLDFLDYLDVTVDSNNNFAQIAFNDSAVGVLANNETVSGSWTFDTGLTANAGAAIHATSDHIEYHESDTANNDYWITEIGSGSYNVDHVDASAGTTTRAVTANGNGRVEAPNGPLYEQGNRVATRPWVTTELGPYADTTATETISAAWTHENTLTLTSDNQFQLGGGNWQAWHSTSNNDLYVDWNGGSTPTTVMRLGSGGAQFPQGATINGNTAATQSWVNSNYASPTTTETITAQWSFDQQIQGEAATAALATDANNLGGTAASSYPTRSANENISGSWAFEAGFTVWEGSTVTLGDVDHVANLGVPTSGGPATLDLASATGFDITDNSGNTVFSLDGSTGTLNIDRGGTLETAATQAWVGANYAAGTHGNGAHSSDFTYSSTHTDVDVQIDEANGVINFVTN